MTDTEESLAGVLVIDKPAGMTSARVVAVVKRTLGARKVGHTGTLDPMATGVLPIVLGEGTKIAGYLLADDKSYRGQIHFGIETDTLDKEGQVTTENPGEAACISRAAIDDAIRELCQRREQIPPMYSALRQGGQRLHKLAREGIVVDRPPRPIRLDRFEVLDYQPPFLDFEVDCSKGTYVRCLARDLGTLTGAGAHLSMLRRLRSGRFDLSQALPLDEVNGEAARERLVPLAAALSHLPTVTVHGELAWRVGVGQLLEPSEVVGVPEEGVLFRVLTDAGRLLALASVAGEKVRYRRVFPGALAAKSRA